MELRWNEWNIEHVEEHGIKSALPGAETMRSAKKSRVARYRRMKPQELREATKRFDAEMVIDTSRALTAVERNAWERARRKPGRPRRGAGVKVISVSVERGLLARSDALASDLGISRASLIERGLKAVLEAENRL